MWACKSGPAAADPIIDAIGAGDFENCIPDQNPITEEEDAPGLAEGFDGLNDGERLKDTTAA